jgi:hypothetical protein
MNIFLGQPVQANLTSPPNNHTARCFPRLTKHTFFAMLKKTKGNP